MLKLIIRQANWGILGSVFAFAIGFFVKRYVFNEVGPTEWGKYATAHTFAVISDTLLCIGIPVIILKFIPKLLTESKQQASKLITVFLRYALFSSLLFVIFMIVVSPYLDVYLYDEIDNFSLILILISLHAPFSIFMGIITSLYRSILKIKEIVLYGTFVTVILRAVVTFIVFQFSKDIISFIILELITQLFTLIILFYLFNKREFKILSIIDKEDYKIDNDVIKYGKNMYAISLVGMLSNQSIAFVLGISLPSNHMGVYSVLLTITSLALFLNKNLTSIFSPAISQLYAEGKMIELADLYKKTTFLVSFFTIPFTILIIFFSLQIFSFYSTDYDLAPYKFHLCVLVIGNVISILVGTSHALMIMAGLEKKALQIQFVRGFLVFLLSFLFIQEYKLDAVVIISLISILFISSFQLYFMKKELNVSPFSRELLLLILFSIPFIYFAITQEYLFELYHIIIVPIVVYFIYFSVFHKQIFNLHKELK